MKLFKKEDKLFKNMFLNIENPVFKLAFTVQYNYNK